MEIIDLDSSKAIGTKFFERTLEDCGRQNSRGQYKDNRHDDYNRIRDRLRERTFSRNYGNNRDRSLHNSRSRSGSYS